MRTQGYLKRRKPHLLDPSVVASPRNQIRPRKSFSINGYQPSPEKSGLFLFFCDGSATIAGPRRRDANLGEMPIDGANRKFSIGA